MASSGSEGTCPVTSPPEAHTKTQEYLYYTYFALFMREHMSCKYVDILHVPELSPPFTQS